jgi:hypothetical protein
MTLSLNRLMDTRGLGPKVAFALRRAFPPPELMRTRSARAHRGRIGLMASYAISEAERDIERLAAEQERLERITHGLQDEVSSFLTGMLRQVDRASQQASRSAE